MSIVVTCEACRSRFSAAEKYAGRTIPCPKCKAILTVPPPPPIDGPEPQRHPPGAGHHTDTPPAGRPNDTPTARPRKVVEAGSEGCTQVLCPSCQTPIQVPAGRPVQVEQTAKRWKLLQLLGAAGAILSAVGGSVAYRGSGGIFAVCVLLLLASLLVFAVARLMAWWFHG